MNEILGRSTWAPIVFGTQAPDTGNAEIIAHYGTDEQKRQYLQPLLDGEMFSSYSMTEPHAGADPTMFTTRAVRDGDEWVINGWKYFSSNANSASFLIVMAVTNPDVSPYKGMSMFLVPTDTPGVNIVRNVAMWGEPMNEGSHALIHYEDVRVPASAVLGGEGQAFVIAQTRLGGGRIHHAMRTIGLAQKAMDMMCERALSRTTQGSLLADKQFVQGFIADSYAQLTQFRLFVLYTAWQIDTYNDYKRVRKDIATAKIVMPTVLHDIAWRAVQVHGALGTSNEMPLMGYVHNSGGDGPGRRSHRGAQDHRRPSGVAQLPRHRWDVAHRVAARQDGCRQGALRPPARVGGGQPVIDIDRLGAWLDGQPLAGRGEPITHRLITGGSQNEIYEIRRGDLHAALRIPPPGAPRRATRASCASGASSRRWTAPTCHTPRPSPAAATRRFLGGPST
ncbi:MAG: acyl-CoA dehydrogenase family protein [Ilumatobacteraceae bacterium]